jgi:hypothetical protein
MPIIAAPEVKIARTCMGKQGARLKGYSQEDAVFRSRCGCKKATLHCAGPGFHTEDANASSICKICEYCSRPGKWWSCSTALPSSAADLMRGMPLESQNIASTAQLPPSQMPVLIPVDLKLATDLAWPHRLDDMVGATAASTSPDASQSCASLHVTGCERALDPSRSAWHGC